MGRRGTRWPARVRVRGGRNAVDVERVRSTSAHQRPMDPPAVQRRRNVGPRPRWAVGPNVAALKVDRCPPSTGRKSVLILREETEAGIAGPNDKDSDVSGRDAIG